MNAFTQAQHAAAEQYLVFDIGGEKFAASVLNVKEVIVFGQITEIPQMPAFIRGVINLRGTIIPVVDLGARLHQRPSTVGKKTCIVIAEIRDGDARRSAGLMVDTVFTVVDIPPDDFVPPPARGTAIRTDFFVGMGRVGDGFAIILDLDSVLAVEEVLLLTGIAERGELSALPVISSLP